MSTRPRALDRGRLTQFGLGWDAVAPIVQLRWPELLAIGSIALTWFLMRSIPVSHDVVWQLWIARQMLSGVKLYGDIVEPNPPLWFWAAIPIQRAAELLKVEPRHAMVAATFVYIAASTIAMSALISDFGARRRAALLALTVTATTVLSIADFEQREHLALIAAMPYIFLIARRAKGGEVHWLLAFAVGALSAYGFALKHYFALVPFFLEIWLIWELRRKWTPFRPETLTLLGAALSYLAAIYFLAPDFLTRIVPMLALAYSGFNATWNHVLFKPFVPFWLVAGLVFVSLKQRPHPIAVAAAISGFAFVLAYFAQQKGFEYHAVAATGALSVALGSLLVFHPPARYALAALLTVVILAIARGPYGNVSERQTLHLLQGMAPGKTVMMLAVNPSTIWPMVEDRGLKWPSRHFASWMLATFAKEMRKNGRLSPALASMAQDVRTDTVNDLSCNPPDLIIVDDLIGTKASGLNAVAFFSEDPDFGALFSHYTKKQVLGNFTSYAKVENWKPVRPSLCRTIY